MPIFEYRCTCCGNEFEVFVRGSENRANCPQCSSEDVSKKFSVFGFKSGAAPMVASSGKSCGGCSSHNCGGCHH